MLLRLVAAIVLGGLFVLLGWVMGQPSHGEEYYNLDQITKDQHQAGNEALQPPYIQGKDLPYISPLECGIERMVPLNTFMESKQRADGTTWFYFDTNKDGYFDVTMSLPTQELETAKANGDPVYPHLYFFDRDYVQTDQGPTPEIGYADTVRDGKCRLGEDGNIKIYWVPSKESGKIGESDCIRGDCDKRQEGDL